MIREDAPAANFERASPNLDAKALSWMRVSWPGARDLIREDGRWTNKNARGYQRPQTVRNPYRLRLNAYRVLLTRGRDACIVFIPPVPMLDETYDYLLVSGFLPLTFTVA